ncbi:serine protein kinase RIO [Kutzneria kofuensis]|uniref:non-specific serine/threonine protein kinase n=1 Tax=Kutzneria kofuensis TaxID=103725 RepID=A0A7W9NJC9_9PSEU|nr:RIO1 family regulatory kinase/ATPase [Kutzneria kofuensis]MBB5894201.1 RIO kinase 1 [Kutzneria kofuensis]
MREHDFDFDLPDSYPTSDRRRGRRRFDDDEPRPTRRGRLTEEARGLLAQARADAMETDALPEGADRWSTWGDGDLGPEPRPEWLITEAAAVDHELGPVKTGKEADVFLLRRSLPGAGRATLLAAKRYRSNEHRMFHRDAGYLEGRRLRKSREMRAVATRTTFGRNLIAEQWAIAEFAALCRLWTVGVPVPYPVQRTGTELLLEFLGDPDGAAAPRLAQLRPVGPQLRELWYQLVEALRAMASMGLAHGDLSAYNLLVHDNRLMLIDLPQVVDIVANPRGPEFLARDVRNITSWFAAKGLPVELANAEALIGELLAEAGMG